MPMDHCSLIVPSSEFEGIIAFCIASLKHTGFKEWYRPVPHAAGLGDGRPYFWIAAFDLESGDSGAMLSILKRQHIAFAAESQCTPISTPHHCRLLQVRPNVILEPVCCVKNAGLTDLNDLASASSCAGSIVSGV